MTGTAEETIAALRAKLGARTDAELARKLGIDKSTVSSWKARGNVPGRFANILTGKRSHQTFMTPPIAWGEDETAAFELALFRFARATADQGTFETYRAAFENVTSVGPRFWSLMEMCLSELLNRQSEGDYPLHTALGLAMFDDFETSSQSIKRDQSLLGGDVDSDRA